MAFSAMLRTGESFGAEHLIAILRGERDRQGPRPRPRPAADLRRRRRPLARPSGRRSSASSWASTSSAPTPSATARCRLTEAARPILRGEASLTLRADTVRRAAARGRAERRRWRRSAEEDEGLLAALKAKRRALADAAGVPAYVIFPDRTLIEMATAPPARPSTRSPASPASARSSSSASARRFLAVLTGAPPPPAPPGPPPPRRPARRARSSTGCTPPSSRSPAAPTASPSTSSCTAATLARIAEERPATLAALERIQGMGPLKAERFGEAFLAILQAPRRPDPGSGRSAPPLADCWHTGCAWVVHGLCMPPIA